MSDPPVVTCIVCGRTGNRAMGLISSPWNAPHRWLCRKRKPCLARKALADQLASEQNVVKQ